MSTEMVGIFFLGGEDIYLIIVKSIDLHYNISKKRNLFHSEFSILII